MEDLIKLIKEYSVEHPARVMQFDKLSQGLFNEINEGNVSVTYHPEFPHLAIFKYTQDCVMERAWNEFSVIARGLILDLKNKVVVATPFIKFFNYDEVVEANNFIQPEFVVTEKLDGSLGIMFFYEDEWRVATAGSFASEQAIWATNWVNNNMPLDDIDKNNTYLFEIIYFENKIVVQYDFEGLVLLSIVDSFGLEYNYEQLKIEALHMATRCADQYDFDGMDSILKNAETLDQNNEGYVIRFKSGVRLKIKGDEYVRIHRLISRVTPLAIWESVLNGDDLEDVRIDLPEEMQKDFDTIISIHEQNLRDFIKEVTILYEESKIFLSDKDLALDMEKNPDSYKSKKYETAKSYIFMMRKCSFYPAMRDYGSWTRRRIFKAFRPRSNVLKGYTPSSVVNRFVDNV